MNAVKPIGRWIWRHPLLLFLPLQAALLFHNLELLPVWTDEGHTLATVSRPLAEIGRELAADIHPPLYFFLAHEWLRLPLPGSPVARLRALSVLWALLAAVAIERLWLARAEVWKRWWFLSLWTCSPCVLLYARMARSYGMQVFVGCLAMAAALSFLRKTGDARALLLYAGGALALLYTHYLPGAAILVSVVVILAWRVVRNRDWRLLGRLALAHVLLGVAFLPWIMVFGGAVAKWTFRPGVYQAVPSAALDHGVKLAYWFVSFGFGETIPPAVVLAAVALVPVIVWLLGKGLASAPKWRSLMLLAAVTGYIGVGRWVSFSFVPARLLFLFPFYLLLLLEGCGRARRLGRAACAAVLLVSLGSIHSYFGKEDFLNKGYAAPFDEMAALVRRGGSPEKTLVILDTYNTDAFQLRDRLEASGAVVLVRDAGVFDDVERLRRKGAAETIWYLRNTHDVSPGGLNRRLETELAGSYEVRRHLFQPYSAAERWIIRRLGWPEQPTHFYQVLEMRAPTAAVR